MEGDQIKVDAGKLQVDGSATATKKLAKHSFGVGKAETPAVRAARIKTTLTTMFAFIVERADESVLTSTYAFIGRDLNATPAQLGVISMWRGLVQAVCSPFTGLLGDRLNRAWLIGVGALIWGVMTAGIGASKTLSQAMGFAAANGIGLAILIPCAQSLLADYYHPSSRGIAFGLMYCISSLGNMATGFFSTSIGGEMVGGVQGWRFSFYLVAALSGLAALLSFVFGSEPRTTLTLPPPGKAGGTGFVWMWRRIKEMARDLSLVLRIPTFIMIVIQGFFGTMPWMAMGFMTLYLQMLGFSDVRAAAIWAIFNLGNSFGNFGGGIIGDWASKRYPTYGRVLSAHFSAAMSIPYAVIVLKCLPVDYPNQNNHFGLYVAVFFLFSLVISWPYTNNSAIYSEIVPEQLRTSVFAFDRCFEGAVGSTAGPLVGIIAQRIFGFKGTIRIDAGAPKELQEHNARALGNAMLGILLFFWILCITFYFALYYTFPRDRLKSAALGRRLEREALEAAGQAPPADDAEPADPKTAAV